MDSEREIALQRIDQKALAALGLHIPQPVADGFRQESIWSPGERGRLGSAEYQRGPRKAEFVDGPDLQERPKQPWAAFANNRPHPVVAPEDAEHCSEIDFR